MAVTIKDVAKHAGVSVCTVSRVLNNTYRNKVSAQTRKRVLEVSEELGYRPSIIARGLKGKITNLVGYVVPNVASSFLANTLMGIQKTAEDYGYSILVYTTMGD
ncbi:MAG: LacI family DNA-binding transcriptional regulator, partial [Firmicutes bacterium]|nr:LacI family DNA-binding transcriptional regulator [Bacillota bacterium]